MLIINTISTFIIIYCSLLLSDIVVKMSNKSILDMYNIITNEFQLIKNPIHIYSNTFDIKKLAIGHIIITLFLLTLYFQKKLKKVTRTIRKKLMIEDENKRKVIVFFLYAILVSITIYFSLLASELWQKISDRSAFDMYNIIISEFQLLKNPIRIYQDNSINTQNLFIGHIVIAATALLLLYYSVDKKGEFALKEKGSAKWATKKDRLKYELDIKKDNIILSETEYLPLNMRQIYRNVNIILIGGSGTGKTRYFVKPNLMQLNSSYVITDPKGELYRDSAYMLKENGYDVKVLNLKDPSFSNGFNSFEYIRSETDIDILAETIMKNTLGKENRGGDPFWENSSKALLTALLHYTNKLEDNKRNLTTVFKLMLEGKMEEEDELTELDIKFRELSQDHPAKNYYDIFSLAPMKTRNSILISLGTQLAFLGSKKVRNIVLKDTMDLKNHSKKRAIFVIIPDSNGAYDVLASIFYTQFFQILYEEADNQEDGQLDIHHQFILDEFANIGKIPNFVKLIATMRSRKISAIPIVQNQAQIENLYGKNSRTIIGNCDTLLYLGGSDKQAAKEISERLGKATITVTDVSLQKNEGQSNSYTKNTRKDYRELMTTDEVLRLSDEELLITIRGFKPFKSKKFNIESHENYKILNSKKTFYNEAYEKDENIKKSNYINEDNKDSEIDIDIEDLSKKTEELLLKSDQLLETQI